MRRYAVGMSVDALASAWARQESAPDGAAVVVGNEVSGRLRGGEPWVLGGDDAAQFAMVVRPGLDPLQEALLWLPASLAAADALGALGRDETGVLWPDAAFGRSSGAPECRVNVLVQLGPGRIEHAIFAVRIDLREIIPPDDREAAEAILLSTYVAAAQRHVQLLGTDPEELLAGYADRCAQMNERVRVQLLPRGEARGRVAAVDADGFLVLETPTGMLERIAPATLRSIEIA